MKQVTYSSYRKINFVAKMMGQEILQTPVSFYFKVFKEGKCTETYIFYKPKIK